MHCHLPANIFFFSLLLLSISICISTLENVRVTSTIQRSPPRALPFMTLFHRCFDYKIACYFSIINRLLACNSLFYLRSTNLFVSGAWRWEVYCFVSFIEIVSIWRPLSWMSETEILFLFVCLYTKCLYTCNRDSRVLALKCTMILNTTWNVCETV